ncbi:hypothetical protein E2C01_042683 [Portunus trituberculatus]|uniref:Uncharacterized protein n=1 Tax=Portunus trituberculatus TaxID=210409 RepID=A0A5B7FU23_PORTR|nr:hypothetical protein [Portunus trituberculatus]
MFMNIYNEGIKRYVPKVRISEGKKKGDCEKGSSME